MQFVVTLKLVEKEQDMAYMIIEYRSREAASREAASKKRTEYMLALTGKFVLKICNNTIT